MADDARRWYGVQFHPEVTHTKQGEALLRRFVVDICGCETLWTAAHIIDDQIARVHALIGEGDVLLGLSRSEEHTSELQSLMRISYAVFCLKKKKTNTYI